MALQINPRGLLLVIIFSAVEILALIYWLVFGNSTVGIIILAVGLVVEHSTAATQAEFFPLFKKKT